VKYSAGRTARKRRHIGRVITRGQPRIADSSRGLWPARPSSRSTPSPGPVGTATDPSRNSRAPGTITSPVFHGQCVSQARSGAASPPQGAPGSEAYAQMSIGVHGKPQPERLAQNGQRLDESEPAPVVVVAEHRSRTALPRSTAAGPRIALRTCWEPAADLPAARTLAIPAIPGVGSSRDTPGSRRAPALCVCQ